MGGSEYGRPPLTRLLRGLEKPSKSLAGGQSALRPDRGTPAEVSLSVGDLPFSSGDFHMAIRHR